MLRQMHQVTIRYAYMLIPQHPQPNPVCLSAVEPIAWWFLLSGNYVSPPLPQPKSVHSMLYSLAGGSSCLIGCLSSPVHQFLLFLSILIRPLVLQKNIFFHRNKNLKDRSRVEIMLNMYLNFEDFYPKYACEN